MQCNKGAAAALARATTDALHFASPQSRLPLPTEQEQYPGLVPSSSLSPSHLYSSSQDSGSASAGTLKWRCRQDAHTGQLGIGRRTQQDRGPSAPRTTAGGARRGLQREKQALQSKRAAAAHLAEAPPEQVAHSVPAGRACKSSFICWRGQAVAVAGKPRQHGKTPKHHLARPALSTCSRG